MCVATQCNGLIDRAQPGYEAAIERRSRSGLARPPAPGSPKPRLFYGMLAKTRSGGLIAVSLILAFGIFTNGIEGLQLSSPSVSYEGQQVASVYLIARPSVDVDSLRPLILQAPGQPYSNQKVKASISALKKTGEFSEIDLEVTAEPAGLRVTFIMQPAFYIGTTTFPGATKSFSYPSLLQVVNYPDGEPYSPGRAQNALPALRSFFAEHGYFTARVQLQTQLDKAHQLANLIFHITLGRRARFGSIVIAGAPPSEARRLEESLRSLWAALKGASLKPGKPYSHTRIVAAFGFLRSQLGKQGRLAAEIHLDPTRYEPETNRADLTYRVTPGPKISIRLEGAHVWKRTQRKLLPFYQENSFDQDLVQEGKGNLVSYFQSKGYFDVKVNPQTETTPSQISLVYHIQKGRRHRVKEILMRGDQRVSEDDLDPLVTIRRARFFSRGRFSNDLLAQSVRNLTGYYRQNGYENVTVRARAVDREPNVYVTFQITEGPQTIVDAVRIDGNKTQPLAKLAPRGLRLKAGQPYSQPSLNHDRDRIMSAYLNLGYLNAAFKPQIAKVPGRPHHVEVTYVINEGPQAFIQSVLIMGQRRTQTQFISRTANIQSGAPLSERELLGSESRLYDLGIFDWASVQPRRPITNQRQEPVLVKVHETKRNSLSYGVGLEVEPRTGNLPAGTVALPGLPIIGLPSSFRVTQKNFVSPRGSVEYSRLNMMGRGETGAASVLLSRLDQRGTLTYSDPHFHGLDWSSLFSVSGERNGENPLFTAGLEDASFQLQRTLDSRRTKTLQLRYSFSRTLLSNLLIPALVLPQDRSIRLSTFSATFIHDTRDNPLDARHGVYQTLDFGVNPKIIGSSADFTRFLGQAAFYHPIRPSLVWANSVRIGVAKPFGGDLIPLSERFFSGGADSLRGFPTFGAGPQRTVPACTDSKNPATCVDIRVPVGGNELFIWNSEGRFPLPVKKGLGGVIFYDGGNVYDHIVLSNFLKEYTNTVGFGIRYDTPVGPIRLDIGRSLNPSPGIKATQFFITIGQAF
ncbi:MAG: POTRA domain-containing protein [Terriglobia bacterium]